MEKAKSMKLLQKQRILESKTKMKSTLGPQNFPSFASRSNPTLLTKRTILTLIQAYGSSDNLKHREKIVLEVLSTEQTYFQGLNILITEYLEPLRKDEKNATEAEIQEIFGNVQDIRVLTREVLDHIEERLWVWEEDGQDHIGDILVYWVIILAGFSINAFRRPS